MILSWQNKEEVLVDEWSKQARDLLLGFAEKINLPNRYCLYIPDSEALKDYECVVFLKFFIQFIAINWLIK